MTILCRELFVLFDDDETATVTTYRPDGAESGAKVERHLISGPHAPFPGSKMRIGSFDQWRWRKEGEGFVFEPLET